MHLRYAGKYAVIFGFNRINYFSAFRIDCSIIIEPVAARTVGRPTSGFLNFDVRKTVTARFGSAIKTKDPPRELDRVGPILNRLYRDAKAIELDSLCIESVLN
jgi:hypothetical protein